MSAYTELVRLMRDQGAAKNSPAVQLAVMTAGNGIRIGDMEISGKCLYFAEHLIHPVCTKVSVPQEGTDASEYLEPLKEGDLVMVQRLTGQRYLVIGKAVAL